MNTSGVTTPLCDHCGRPIIMSAMWHGGRAYHYECTHSPYANRQFTPPAMPTTKVKEKHKSDFDKWYKEKYYKYDLYPKYTQFRKEMKEVWQAATAESDKRIAELQAFIRELSASINVLREALEIAVEYQRSDVANFHSAYAGYKDEKHEQYDEDLKLVENALAKTPAQSLAERKEQWEAKLMAECTDPNQ